MNQLVAFLAAVGVVAVIAMIVWIAAASITDVKTFYEGKNDGIDND